MVVKEVSGTMWHLRLEAIVDAVSLFEIPRSWKQLCYPTLRPLTSFMADLVDRVKYMRDWADGGEGAIPVETRLDFYFFPATLLLAVLQNFARKKGSEFDNALEFGTRVLKEVPCIFCVCVFCACVLSREGWVDGLGAMRCGGVSGVVGSRVT